MLISPIRLSLSCYCECFAFAARCTFDHYSFTNVLGTLHLELKPILALSRLNPTKFYKKEKKEKMSGVILATASTLYSGKLGILHELFFRQDRQGWEDLQEDTQNHITRGQSQYEYLKKLGALTVKAID